MYDLLQEIDDFALRSEFQNFVTISTNLFTDTEETILEKRVS